MQTYISVNLVDQALILIKSIQTNHCSFVSDLKHLRLPYGVKWDAAFNFAVQCHWVANEDNNIVFTQVGQSILEKFIGETIDKYLWQTILFEYIVVCQPVWSKRIPFGRKEAFLIMNEEEQRCFVESSLISSYDEDVIEWWDSLSEIVRSNKSHSLDDLGRKGERLTLEFEENRTRKKPDWRSIESNLAGYDVLSQRSAENTDHILIEVKTSSKSIENALAVITRHEWDIAHQNNNLERYYFYFWCLSGTTKHLAIIDVKEMSYHIPKDNAQGNWESVRVPFAAFLDKFKKVL